MGKHWRQLQWEDRLKLEALHSAGHKAKEIAEILHVHYTTIYNELKRGQYEHLNSDYTTEVRYSPEIAQRKYEEGLKNRGADLKIGKDFKLANYIEKKIVEEGYSPRAVVGEIKAKGMSEEFDTMICPVTLYSYIDKGIFLRLTNKHLPIKRNQKRDYNKIIRHQKRANAGDNINLRPESIETREEFGHWEMDSVVGKQSVSKNALLVLTERKTREEIICKLPDHTAASVVAALDELERLWGESFKKVFKTITVDNGSEFADVDGIERSCLIEGEKRTKTYYCHPYCSWERGSNENANKLIRRHIPKGSNFDSKTEAEIIAIQEWMNHYPRRIFGYRTSEELFQEELALIA